MARGHFDADTFHSALDSVRSRKNLTWKKVAEQSGVSASTLTRMAQGRRPDVDSLAALASWSGLDVSTFFITEQHEEATGENAIERVVALFRADPRLPQEAKTAIEKTLKALYETFRTEPKP